MTKDDRGSISTRNKCYLLFGAWGLVAFFSMVPYPSQILMAPFFPIGLLALLPKGNEKAIAAWMQMFPSLLGWGFYIFISISIVRTKGRKDFALSFILLCILLALNVAGCKKVLEAAAAIH